MSEIFGSDSDSLENSVTAAGIARVPMRAFDRVKFVVLLVSIWIIQLWISLVDNPLQSINDAGYVVTNSGSGRLVAALVIVEAIRQLHFLISEWNVRYFEFWEEFFKIVAEQTQRINPWTRFLVKRITVWSISVFIAASAVGAASGLSAFEAVVIGAQSASETIPAAIQIFGLLIFIVIQFELIFWLLWRSKFDLQLGGKNNPAFVRVDTSALHGSEFLVSIKMNTLLRRLRRVSLRYGAVNLVLSDSHLSRNDISPLRSDIGQWLCAVTGLLSSSAQRLITEARINESGFNGWDAPSQVRVSLLTEISQINREHSILIPSIRQSLGMKPRRLTPHRIHIVAPDISLSPQSRHAHAIHTASHVVVAMRVRPESITSNISIEPTAATLKQLSPRDISEHHENWISSLDDDIVILLAATACEKLFYDKDQTFAAIADSEDAKRLISFGLDRQTFAIGVDNSATAQTKLKELLDRSTKLVAQNRKEILSVAHALEISTAITPEDVIAILNGAYGTSIDGTIYKTLKVQKQLAAYHADALLAHKDRSVTFPPVPVFHLGTDI